MLTLVTGATGFLGTNLVHRLVSEGDSVRVLARSRAKSEALGASRVDVVTGEITDGAALDAALPGVEAVYHLAGILFAPNVPADAYYQTHVEGTRLLLSRCARSSTLRSFVHCSTTGVLGATGELPAREDAPAAPTNAYEESKWQGELLVRAAQGEGFPATIVRPGLVYGPGDLHLLGFFRAIQRGFFRSIGSRPVWLHPIYVDDMTEAMARVATDARSFGDCFHIAGTERVSLRMLAGLIASALGTSLPAGTIPLPAARLLAAFGDVLPPRLRPSAPLTSSRLAFLTHSRSYDVSKARRVLGFTARTDLREGIGRAVAWYRQHGYLPASRGSFGDAA